MPEKCPTLISIGYSQFMKYLHLKPKHGIGGVVNRNDLDLTYDLFDC